MLEDCERVGFPMGRRARDSGLPHERGYLRRLEQEPPLNDEEPGDEHEWVDEQRPQAGARIRLTAVQREKRLGCPGCPRLVARACTGCGGWVGRPAGAPPACTHQDCPGASYSEGGVRVRRRKWRSAPGPPPPPATNPTRCAMRVAATRHVTASWATDTEGHIKLSIKPSPLLHVALQIRVTRTQRGREVTFKVPSAQVRREERKQDEDPQHSVRTLPSEGEVEAVGGGRCARTRQAQTTTERLRREGVRVHEDTRFEIGPPRPLADLRHIVGGCAGTPERLRQVERLAYAVRDLRDNTLPRRRDTQEFHRLMHDACLAIDSMARGTLTEGGWESLDCIFSAMVPDFAREEGTQDERAVLVAAVIRTLQPVHTIAAGILAAWKKAHDGEVRRRQDQERARGTMRLIVRAWREQTDGRKAMSLRGAKDWNIERHAPCRVPTDCLPTLTCASIKRKPDDDEQKADELWEKTVVKEQKCEGGGGRLPEARSALPAGSQARLLLTHIRLVEGGRLKALRAANPEGSRRRRAARVDRGQTVSLRLGAGWLGQPSSVPGDKRRQEARVDDRGQRHLERDRRQHERTAEPEGDRRQPADLEGDRRPHARSVGREEPAHLRPNTQQQGGVRQVGGKRRCPQQGDRQESRASGSGTGDNMTGTTNGGSSSRHGGSCSRG